MSKKDNIVGDLLLRVVVGGTFPVATSNRLGFGLGAVDLGLVLSRSLDLLVGLGLGLSLGLFSNVSRGSGNGCRSSSLGGRAAKVVVLPGDNLSVDGGGYPLGALLLALLMEVLVAVTSGMDVRRGGNLTLLVFRGEVVDSDFLEVERSTDVNGELQGG